MAFIYCINKEINRYEQQNNKNHYCEVVNKAHRVFVNSFKPWKKFARLSTAENRDGRVFTRFVRAFLFKICTNLKFSSSFSFFKNTFFASTSQNVTTVNSLLGHLKVRTPLSAIFPVRRISLDDKLIQKLFISVIFLVLFYIKVFQQCMDSFTFFGFVSSVLIKTYRIV